MNKVKLTIAGGGIAVTSLLGGLGIGVNSVAIEETPRGIFINFTEPQFDTLRNGLAKKCAFNDPMFASIAERDLFFEALNHQWKKDGGSGEIKNDGGQVLNEKDEGFFRAVCKSLIR